MVTPLRLSIYPLASRRGQYASREIHQAAVVLIRRYFYLSLRSHEQFPGRREFSKRKYEKTLESFSFARLVNVVCLLKKLTGNLASASRRLLSRTLLRVTRWFCVVRSFVRKTIYIYVVGGQCLGKSTEGQCPALYY